MDSRIADLKRGVEELESRVSSLEEIVVDEDALLNVKIHHTLNSSPSPKANSPKGKSQKKAAKSGADGEKKASASPKPKKSAGTAKESKGSSSDKTKTPASDKDKGTKVPSSGKKASEKANKTSVAEKTLQQPGTKKATKRPAADKALESEKRAKQVASEKADTGEKPALDPKSKGTTAGKSKGAKGKNTSKKETATKVNKAAAASTKSQKGQVLKGVQGKTGRVTKRKAASFKFYIDCRQPVEDGIMNAADFETYLLGHIKINGKTNNLSNKLRLERNKDKIIIHAEVHFSKRYLKYLTKKYLKKNNLRDWLRVVAPPGVKDTYEIRYFQINNDEDDDDDDDGDE
ncbi:large ribosomal subunit protein eL22-like [Macrobrachium nipponense]|uniref:large ribosomal subunit protein eL22-like n=1 Tax=Macrobrachium nipponense TaxID=159736 RepID=UPI0030C8B9AE